MTPLDSCGAAGDVYIVLTNSDDDTEWQTAAYDQFLKDDSEEDAVYEALA